MPLLRKKIVLKEMRARGQALGNGTPQGVKKKKKGNHLERRRKCAKTKTEIIRGSGKSLLKHAEPR